MACGEYGPGRMAEPVAIVAAIGAALGGGPLAGRHVLVTSGPTHEPIDPVRYIANRSSGAQGHGAGGGAARSGRAGDLCDRAGRRCRRPPGWRWSRVETAARDAGGGPGGAAGRCGGDGGGGGRLAGGQCGGAEDEEGRRRARPRRWSLPRTRTFWPRCRRARSGPGWWWALPPRRRMWWPMPRPSGRARAATGSWPMMCRRRPGSWAGAENAVTVISDAGRRGLAADGQGRGGAASWRRGLPRRWREGQEPPAGIFGGR